MKEGIRTVVVHLGGIGDFLLTCPALRLLSEEGPLELVGHRERLELAVAAGWAGAAHGLDGVGFSSAFGEPDGRLRTFLGQFDRCVAWIKDEDGQLTANLRACGVAQVETYPGLPPADWGEPASVYYARCLGYEEAPEIRLDLEPGEACFDVLIHPGSGGRHKNWPLERFEAVGRELENEGRSVVWCRGPAEEEMVFRAEARTMAFDSLVSLGRALAGAQVYVGNDSGVTHLAACVGCSTVAVFGPTDPAVWAPQGGHVRVVRGEPWPSVDEVLAAVRSLRCQG